MTALTDGAPPAAPRAPWALPALARAELTMGLRRPIFWVLIGLAAVLGWSVGGAPGRGASLSAYAAAEAAWQYLGLVGIAWVSLVAVRETALRTDRLVYSKPQASENLVLSRFAGAFAQILLLLTGLFIGALVSRWHASGSLLGASVYATEWVRAIGALLFAAGAAYCLALLSGSVVAGAVVGLAWIVMVAGKEYLAKAYFPAYTQNLPAYLLYGLALVGLAAWAYRARYRGNARAATWLRVVTPLLLALGALSTWHVVRTGHDPLAREDPSLRRMEQQNVEIGQRAPGFLLPDQTGRLVGLSSFPDRILVIALWSPRETESAYLLGRLQRLQQRYGSRGVLPVAVCISEDVGAGAAFARGEALTFPVVTDWGTHNAPRWAEASPLASAYQAQTMPMVAVTDRRRRVRATITGVGTYEGAELDRQIDERLAEEPR